MGLLVVLEDPESPRRRPRDTTRHTTGGRSEGQSKGIPKVSVKGNHNDKSLW